MGCSYFVVFWLFAFGIFSQRSSQLDPELGGSVRLAGDGRCSEYEGRVELQHNGTWGTICDDDFDDADANVLCGMMGYSYGVAIENHWYGDGDEALTIFTKNLECEGTETSVWNCSHYTGDWLNCRHDEDVAVWCVQDADVKPVGHTDVVLTDRNMFFKCEHPGLSGGDYQYSWYKECSPLPDTTRTIEIANISTNDSGTYRCEVKENGTAKAADIMSITVKDKLYARLVGDSRCTPFEGRLELQYRGAWLGVCVYALNSYEAAVACKMLGYSDGVESTSSYGNSSLEMNISEFSCPSSGGITDMSMCTYKVTEQEACSRHKGLNIKCLDRVTITAPGSNVVKGDRVSLTCEFSGADDTVEYLWKRDCVEIGRGATLIFDPVDFDDSKLYSCEVYNGSTLVGLGEMSRSFTVMPLIPVRLSDEGNGPQEGRVEVRYNGTWWSVCGTSWYRYAGRSLCRSLGYSKEQTYRGLKFGEGPSPVKLRMNSCKSSYTSLSQCTNRGWGERIESCNREDDAAVRCSGCASSVDEADVVWLVGASADPEVTLGSEGESFQFACRRTACGHTEQMYLFVNPPNGPRALYGNHGDGINNTVSNVTYVFHRRENGSDVGCLLQNSSGSVIAISKFTGVITVDYVKDCDSAPCLNGATCRDELTENNGTWYTCACAERFKGNNCQEKTAGPERHRGGKGGGLNTVDIVVIVIVCVVMVKLIVIFICLWQKKRRQSSLAITDKQEMISYDNPAVLT